MRKVHLSAIITCVVLLGLAPVQATASPISCESAYTEMVNWVGGDSGQQQHVWMGDVVLEGPYSTAEYSTIVSDRTVANFCGTFPNSYICDQYIYNNSPYGSEISTNIHRLEDSSSNVDFEIVLFGNNFSGTTYYISSCEENGYDLVWNGSYVEFSGGIWTTYYVTATYSPLDIDG